MCVCVGASCLYQYDTCLYQYDPTNTLPHPGLPKFRGVALRDNPDFPAVSRWLAAMEARPAYQRVRSDDQTVQVGWVWVFYGAYRIGRAWVRGEVCR